MPVVAERLATLNVLIEMLVPVDLDFMGILFTSALLVVRGEQRETEISRTPVGRPGPLAAQTSIFVGPPGRPGENVPRSETMGRQPRQNRLFVLWAGLAILAASAVGCRSPRPCCDMGLVGHELACRIGTHPQQIAPCHEVVPAGVIFEDGLSEDEAVHIALTNNSLFQATLAQLGMAAGDAKQASLITNPQLLIYFPTATKEGQYTLYQSIESFLLRPVRIKVANREFRRIGAQLVQGGLDVTRDVRLAYTDLALAVQQAELAPKHWEFAKILPR